MASNLLRGGLVLVIPLTIGALGTGKYSYEALLIITFLVSTLTQFFTPAEQSAITLVVEREQLLTANSVYATTVMGALILGFAVGKPALQFADVCLGQWGQEILVGGCYAIAGLILGTLATGGKNKRAAGVPYLAGFTGRDRVRQNPTDRAGSLSTTGDYLLRNGSADRTGSTNCRNYAPITDR